MPSFRSRFGRCSIKKGVLENFTKFTGKHLCQSLFFKKVAGLRPVNLLKRRLWHWCFPVNFAKFSRTPFSQSTSGRLILVIFPGAKNHHKGTKNHHKGTLQFPRGLGKSLPEYLILQECSEFVLSIKMQNTSISQIVSYILSGTRNFANVPQYSIEQLFSWAEFLLSRTPQIPRQKHPQNTSFTNQLQWLLSIVFPCNYEPV